MSTSLESAAPLILASGSPRRRELLSLLGIPFIVRPADIDEAAILARQPRELVLKVALSKAHAAEEQGARGLILAADTVVVLEGRIYGKPADATDAERMLEELGGRTHSVFTAVAVHETGGATLLDAVEAPVTMRALTAAERAAYVATGEPMDKAGAYAVQGAGRAIVEAIHGDFFTVMGLPVRRALEMLAEFRDCTPYWPALEALESDPRWR